MSTPSIAAIVPCYNEEAAIATVVADLKRHVPGIDVYVYDNNSQDRTVEVAAAAGAIVRREERPGKGNVIRRAFADIEADVYVMIDGDDTYGVEVLPEMIAILLAGPYDHVLGCRQDNPEYTAYRPGHGIGNKIFAGLVSKLFGAEVTDLFSGYRVMSRRFVKSFPALSSGFEIETELTVHFMDLRAPNREVPCSFKDRPAGSESKLSTVKDGARILAFIGRLFAAQHPAIFYGLIALVAFAFGLTVGIPVIVGYAQTGLVERFPSAILASSLMVLAGLAITTGIVTSGILRARKEVVRLAYLQYPPLYLPDWQVDSEPVGAKERKAIEP